MPNTLAHFEVQGIATRMIIKDADHKWIFLGSIIPDIPWIILRIEMAVGTEIDPLGPRLIAIAQSSFAGCLLLSAGLSLISKKPKMVFMILALNSFFHLLLDACQTKWGNGVILIAPFSWETWNFALFWPETWPTYLLTILGLAYFILFSYKESPRELIL